MYTFEFYPNSKEAVEASRSALVSPSTSMPPRRATCGVRAATSWSGRARDSKAGTILLRAPGDTYEAYKNKMPDASESPWLYLFFLVILIVEQALAVHLSFHLKGNEAAAGGTARDSATGRGMRSNRKCLATLLGSVQRFCEASLNREYRTT